jgi:hypothetical protein
MGSCQGSLFDGENPVMGQQRSNNVVFLHYHPRIGAVN